MVIIGQNETESQIADRLIRAGASLIRIDPASKSPAGSLEEAVSGADVILAMDSSTGPSRIAQRVVSLHREDALYADLNTGTPATKRQLAALFPNGSFVDVAIVQKDRVPAGGLVMDVAGTGVRRLIELLEPSGDGPPVCFGGCGRSNGAGPYFSLFTLYI